MYLIFSTVAVYIAVWVWPLGQPTALLKLADWQGVHCGLSRNRGKPLLYFCPRHEGSTNLQMWYPICVSTCPQGEKLLCPKNLRHTTTTSTTTQLTTTTTEDFYHAIQDSKNGGLPYPPYPMTGAYSQYPPRQSFQYPYYRPSSNYAPVIYPRAHASGPPEDWGSPEMNYALPPAAKSEYPWHLGIAISHAKSGVSHGLSFQYKCHGIM